MPAHPGTMPLRNGRYKVLRELGAGGSGVVHLALDVEDDRQVAIKTVRWKSEDQLYRLKREFRGLADLSHPNLASYYELAVGRHHVYLTMEYVDGSPLSGYVEPWTLAAQCAGPPFHEERLRLALAQVARGLDALHSAGIIHRDLSPSNVLVTHRGAAKIVDFSLAQPLAGDWDVAFPVAGRVSYMSPEQHLGESLTPASDWYSLGVVLYECLTGQLPFVGNVFQVARAKIKSAPRDPRDVVRGVPEDLSQLCMGLLQRSPSARPDSSVIRECLAGTSQRGLGKRPENPPEPPFVARSAELIAIRQAQARCEQTQKPAVVVVSGDAGDGKTRLLRQATRDLRTHVRATVLEASSSARESLPLRALDGLVDEISRVWLLLDPDTARRLVPPHPHHVAAMFPVLARVPSLSLAIESEVPQPPMLEHSLAGLRHILRRLAILGPLSLVIDDIHTADPVSLDALQVLMSGTGAPPVVWVLAGLPGDTVERCRTFATDGHTLAFALGPLDRDAAIKLALAAHESLNEEQLEDVLRHTTGNPADIVQRARAFGRRFATGSGQRPAVDENGVPLATQPVAQN